MSLTLYDITVPPMIRGLQILDGLLDKARAHAAATGLAEADLLAARLAPDMLTLVGQIQRASDTAKFAAVRIGQVANVGMADTETSFDDLKARLAATIAFLQAAPAEGFLGREAAEVVVATQGGQMTFTAQAYAVGFVLPNFYFHLTTAYDILRFKGVAIGKRDYLGGV